MSANPSDKETNGSAILILKHTRSQYILRLKPFLLLMALSAKLHSKQKGVLPSFK